jgi:flagellar hook-associated protein 2
MAGFSISGAISGLDTASMIDGLMSIEANQQSLLKNRQAATQKTIDAYAALITKLNGVSSAAATVAKTSTWNGVLATSSSTSVGVTAIGTSPGSVTFDVTSVAKAHTLISDGSIAGTATVVASGPLTLTRNGVDTQIDVGDGSLDSVVKAINNGNYGVRATAVQTSPGQYKLQLRGTSTGAASQFAVAGLDGLSGLSTLSVGADAQVTVGKGSAAEFSVSSATNTFTDLVPGLSFTVSKVESDVTVSANLDSSKVADTIQKLVDAANDALSAMAAQSTWNATTKSGGPLNGEAAVRAAQQKILAMVGSNQAAGVHLTRDGRFSFDKDEFATAFKASPEAVAKQFGAQAAFTPAAGLTGSVSFVRASASTRAGTYAVQVAVAAAKEQWKTEPPGGVIAGQTIVIQMGSRTVTHTAGATDNLADVMAALNTQLSTSGLGLAAAVDGNTLVFTAGSAGASSAFTVTVDGAAAQKVTAGRDVQGSINGVAATGTGTVLTGAATALGAAGLSLKVDLSDADIAATGGAVGTVKYASGFAQSFVDLIADLTSSTGGVLAAAKSGREANVKSLQKQIDAWDNRLVMRRSALTKQFTAMETALASLKSQSSFLSSMPSPSSSKSDS